VKVVAIIQARMGSTRLPGKVMMDLAGEPVLVRVINRVRRASKIYEVIVATTTNSDDNIIVDLCQARGWPVFRGSEQDVLDRYYRTAVAVGAEAILRITSDCPLIEPEIIDAIVLEFLSRYPNIDYASNTIERSYPRGLDVGIMSFEALKKAWIEDRNPAWREHVTQYIIRNPDLFRIHGVENDIDYSYMRWTVDTPEDLAFIRKIYDYFRHDAFNWKEVLRLLELNPEWLEINRNIKQKSVS
jgi:spore coat polysaccharide biosynthesis protein SpsF